MTTDTTHPTDIPPGESDGEGDTCDVRSPLGNMPNPTDADLHDPLFEAVWQAIKTWDVNVPAYYEGYCGANGSHAMLIVDAVRRAPAAPAALADALRQCVAELETAQTLLSLVSDSLGWVTPANADGPVVTIPRTIAAARTALDGAQPQEPAREPSDEEIDDVWDAEANGYGSGIPSWRIHAFARAVRAWKPEENSRG